MAQQLLKTVCDYDMRPMDADQETPCLHHDGSWQAAAEVLDEAETRLRQAERSGDPVGVRAACDELFFNFSKQLFSGLSAASQNPDEGLGSRSTIAQEVMSAADAVRGTGWAVLAWQPVSAQLVVIKSHRHEDLNPRGATPILALDVRDDVYYLWPLTI